MKKQAVHLESVEKESDATSLKLLLLIVAGRDNAAMLKKLCFLRLVTKWV